jgi:hypothetical protein
VSTQPGLVDEFEPIDALVGFFDDVADLVDKA